MARVRDDGLKNGLALAYSQTDAAPRVVARGRGLLAEQIIARAHEHGVYVHESAELVSLLMQVDLDQHIPAELYRAVAELLAWVYFLEHGVPTPLQEPPKPPSLAFAVPLRFGSTMTTLAALPKAKAPPARRR